MRTVSCAALLALMLVNALPSVAQAVLPERGGAAALRENVFGLGLAAGSVSGIGVSFRHHLPSVFSYQITGGIVKPGDRLYYTIGAEVQFDLVRSVASRFYVAGGGGYYYSGSTGHNELEGPGRVGVGLGGEIAIGGGFHASGELIFSYFTDGSVLPLPQIGIHYYFY
jgi:hypothetical protein